jgi:O-antigen ligase
MGGGGDDVCSWVMEFSLVDIVNKLSPTGILILSLGGILLFILCLAKVSYIHMFLLTLSASLVGSSIPVVDNVASLIRWLAIFLLLVFGVLRKRLKVSWGVLLFWGHVYLGLIFLFRAMSIGWQLQRGVLLAIVAIAIPFAYSNEHPKSLKSSLVSISVAAAIYSFLNFLSFPGQAGEMARFSGFARSAPAFSLTLGGLLPFTLWGVWAAGNMGMRIVCTCGFILGFAMLILSGQRAGTIAGLLGLMPLFLTFQKRKIIGSVLLLLLPLAVAFILLKSSGMERVDFLLERYSPEAGLSDREEIWDQAIAEVEAYPFLGRGIGAGETFVRESLHNTYLEVWLNAGFLGLVFFLLSQLYFFYRTIRLHWISKDPEIRSFLALALGYMGGFVFMSLFESAGAGASNLNLILYLFLGVLVSGNHLAGSPGPPLEETLHSGNHFPGKS